MAAARNGWGRVGGGGGGGGGAPAGGRAIGRRGGWFAGFVRARRVGLPLPGYGPGQLLVGDVEMDVNSPLDGGEIGPPENHENRGPVLNRFVHARFGVSVSVADSTKCFRPCVCGLIPTLVPAKKTVHARYRDPT